MSDSAGAAHLRLRVDPEVRALSGIQRMRQIIANVPRGEGERALNLAREHRSSNVARVEAQGPDGAREVVFAHVPNDQIDSLMGAWQQIEDLHVTVPPQGVIALQPPPSEAPDQATDISPRSPLEIFLSGLQSIGSWTGFLGYAAAAGVVVWIGLYTNTSYLLVAAMLIAPFAGPALNLALGTARGDQALVGQSLLRYGASLLVCILVAWLLSNLLRQEIATELMVQTSLISSVTVLLPLTAGAAGALHLCQSERNSLVTAAGAGMLVAASLSPPAGVIGMAAALKEWSMVKSGLFLLLLQLAGINLSGAIVFALFGLTPKGTRYERGRRWLRWVSLALTTVALGALLSWQFRAQPELQRSSLSQRIAAVVRQVINESDLAEPVEIQVRFTRADIQGQNSCLVVGYLQRRDGVAMTKEEIQERLAHDIAVAVRRGHRNVTPLITLTLLQSP